MTSTPLHQLLAQISDYPQHLDDALLIDAFRECKAFGAQALLNGDTETAVFLSKELNALYPATRKWKLAVTERFVALYLTEFEPTLNMAINLVNVPPDFDARLVSTMLVRCDFRRYDEIERYIKLLDKRGQHATMARLIEAMTNPPPTNPVNLNTYTGRPLNPSVIFMDIGIAIDFNASQEQLAPILNLYKKHEASIMMAVDEASPTLMSSWVPFHCGALFTQLEGAGVHKLAEFLFHQYCSDHYDEDLVLRALKAGFTPDIETCRYRVLLESESKGTDSGYYGAMLRMHLGAPDVFPLLIDPTASYCEDMGLRLNRMLHAFADTPSADRCGEIALRFFRAFPKEGELFEDPLPSIYLNRFPDLREGNLQSDLGL
jgi:hypothetical protein